MENFMRIALGGISHEGTTFSPLLTHKADLVVSRGKDILPEGELRQLYDENGVELVPTLFARGTPSGIIEKETYLALKNEILDGLRSAGQLDGVCLALHGAMEVEEIGDGESDLVGAIRVVVGDEVLISASLDLHGNITPELVKAADILTALRTAPHRDGAETRYRAASLLIRALKEGLKPEMVLIPVPLLLPGEKVITEVEPAASLYAMLEDIDRAPGILTSSLMVGFAWADVPHASASVIVVAERDREVAYEQAVRLAEAFWKRREGFVFDVETGSIDESIERALAAPEKPVFISDSGDNPTAGATGDIPLFVERLLAKNVPDAVVGGIADAEAVRTCAAAGLGAELTLSIGGKLDTIHASPLTVTGRVIFLSEAQPVNTAVLRVGGVDVILTADRRPFVTPQQFEALNIDLFSREIVVVKLGYLFPALRDIAPKAIMALSPGVSNEVIEELPYHHVRRPIYPLDRDFAWNPRQINKL
jgi:microcystin degradation protein MlrC